jgi:LPS sulfotransferase NodH
MNIRKMALHHLAESRRPARLASQSRQTLLQPILTNCPPRPKNYIICTTPRSGSWLLSESLASTSVAGNPREWFNAIEEQQHRALWRARHSTNLTFAQYLELARAESTTSNGVSGVKLHYYQFLQLPKKMAALQGYEDLTPAQLIRKTYPNAQYIWLTRLDKIRQAISFLLAFDTDQWWSVPGYTSEHLDQLREPKLEFHAISRMESIFHESDSCWRRFFRENRIQPLVILYEDLAADLGPCITKVLKWLGVHDAESVDIPKPRLRQQSDARNEDWLQRYTVWKDEHKSLHEISRSDGSPNLMDELAIRASTTVPNEWRKWIGQSKVIGRTDDAIIEVLTGNGYSRDLAAAEIDKANADPFLLGALRTRSRLQKGKAILCALDHLAKLNTNYKTVDRCSALSRTEFCERYYSANRPVILQGLMKDWRAMEVWTPGYLKNIAGSQIVEVMTKRDADPNYERNAHLHRTKLPFSEFIDMVNSGKVTNDYYLVANNAFFERPEMKPLLQDFIAFPEYLNQEQGGRQCFLWFGPAGTVTPLHHDTSNILIAQVKGRKRYRLIPSTQLHYVYNNEGVFSDVDCDNPDLTQYPEFIRADIIDIVLNPGEVLFMPVGWWHHVTALDVSITVSFTNFVFPNFLNWEQ